MGLKSELRAMRGYFKMSKGKWDEAYPDLEFAYESGTTKPQYLTAYGALLMQKCNYEKCLEVYERAIKHTPEESGFWPSIKCSMITCKYKLGQMDNALEEVAKLYDEYKSSTVYMLYGYLLMKSGELEKALEVNLEGYDYDQEDAAICDNLGQNYYLMENYEEAKKYFDKALRIKFNMVDSCYFLADIFLMEEHYQKAFDLLEEAMEAPFSALTTVTREQIKEKFDFCEKKLKSRMV